MDEHELSKIVDYHVRHAKNRAYTRYNLELSDAHYDEICNLIKDGKLLEPLKPTNKAGNLEAWVEWRGQKLRAAWNPRLEIIASFWPLTEQPGVEQILTSICPRCGNGLAGTKEPVEMEGQYFHPRCAKKEAKKPLTKPVLVKPPPDLVLAPPVVEKPKPATIVRMPEAAVDVRWYKARMIDAASLLMKGEGFAALLLLDACASLPSGFKPGAEPEKAVEMLQKRMDAEGPAFRDKLNARARAGGTDP